MKLVLSILVFLIPLVSVAQTEEILVDIKDHKLECSVYHMEIRHQERLIHREHSQAESLGQEYSDLNDDFKKAERTLKSAIKNDDHEAFDEIMPLYSFLQDRLWMLESEIQLLVDSMNVREATKMSVIMMSLSRDCPQNYTYEEMEEVLRQECTTEEFKDVSPCEAYR